MRSDLNTILSFLADLFAEGKSYSSINVNRSMLSMTLPHIDGFQIGNHPLVVKLLKGCYNLNPPRPRYRYFWDPDNVLDFMRQDDENGSLSLASLSGKLATIMALSTLLRVSELASISRSTINFSAHGVTFHLSKPRKTQHQGPLSSVSLPKCADRRVCPVRCLGIYMYRTETLLTQSCNDRLFLTLIAPFRPVTGSTVGRWIRSYLSKAGIDTAVFSAHSTRGAGASKAVANGVPIDTVLRAAQWAKESTFAKFYHRSVSSGSVADSILGS